MKLISRIFNKQPKSTARANLPPLKFYNTFSDELERFESLSSGLVKVYNCGPTAYDRQHIGNLFPPVVANTLRRALEYWGYRVQEANNITDFGHISEDEASEDKMTRGMRREKLEPTLENMRVLADKYAELFWEDLPHLNVNPEKVRYPFASDYIHEQIALIETLEQKGYAYRTRDGVYFDVSRYPAYGRLGNIDLAGLQAGARVEENPDKRGPFDFALWKLDDKFGWNSPWGLGFPGWHTECVAMIFSLLGRQIDLHLGGADLIPVHHNNEIALAESATGRQFVRYWIHNAHITVEGKKISKSIGNTIYLSDIIDRGITPLALRYWFMTAHYRTPANFTWEALEGAQTALNRLTKAYQDLVRHQASDQKPDPRFMHEFLGHIANDLDTPKALASVWELVRNQDISPEAKRASLVEADKILGLKFTDTVAEEEIKIEDLPEDVQKLLSEREAARAAKDFVKSDELRDTLKEIGYDVSDTSEGQNIKKKATPLS